MSTQKTSKIVYCVMASVLCSAPCLAVEEITVEIHDGGTTELLFDAGVDFTIAITSSTTRVNIFANNTGAAADIGRVTINGSGASNLNVFIGDGAFPALPGTLDPAGGDFGGLVVSNSTQRENTSFAGRINDNQVGDIRVGKLLQWDVDGTIQASIRATHSVSDRFQIHAGGSTVAGSIVCDLDDIELVEFSSDMLGRVEATEGSILDLQITGVGSDLLGDVLAPEGEIQSIVIAGNIGTSSDPVTITAGQNLSTDGTFNSIGLIEADAIWADITANDFARGDLKELNTLDGDFVGSLTTFSIQGTGAGEAAMTIDGDLDADIFAEGSIKRPIEVSGIFPAGRIIKIGGDLKDAPSSSAEIDIQTTNGLKGQIVINASDNGNLWSGVIQVDGTTLSTAPSYDNLPSTFGGGAVGLGPFKFHAKACDPVHESSTITSPTFPAPSEAKMEFYGELIDDSGANAPVTLKRKSLVEPSTWEDVTSNYTISVSGRVVTVTPTSGNSFGPIYKDRITPVAGRLSSNNVDGEPDVEPTAHTFSVKTAAGL